MVMFKIVSLRETGATVIKRLNRGTVAFSSGDERSAPRLKGGCYISVSIMSIVRPIYVARRVTGKERPARSLAWCLVSERIRDRSLIIAGVINRGAGKYHCGRPVPSAEPIDLYPDLELSFTRNEQKEARDKKREFGRCCRGYRFGYTSAEDISVRLRVIILR